MTLINRNSSFFCAEVIQPGCKLNRWVKATFTESYFYRRYTVTSVFSSEWEVKVAISQQRRLQVFCFWTSLLPGDPLKCVTFNFLYSSISLSAVIALFSLFGHFRTINSQRQQRSGQTLLYCHVWTNDSEHVTDCMLVIFAGICWWSLVLQHSEILKE